MTNKLFLVFLSFFSIKDDNEDICLHSFSNEKEAFKYIESLYLSPFFDERFHNLYITTADPL